MGVGQEVLNVPFGEMIYQMASAIAQSQVELDAASVDVLAKMGNKEKYPVTLPIWDSVGNEDEIVTSMVGAGFQPTFYQFTDAIIEVKMAITMSHSSENSWSLEDKNEVKTDSSSKSWWRRKSSSQSSVRTTTVNAGYTSKYSFKEEASSTLRVRLVPLPPNPIIQRLIDIRAKRQEMELDLQMKQLEAQIAAEAAKST